MGEKKSKLRLGKSSAGEVEFAQPSISAPSGIESSVAAAPVVRGVPMSELL